MLCADVGEDRIPFQKLNPVAWVFLLHPPSSSFYTEGHHQCRLTPICWIWIVFWKLHKPAWIKARWKWFIQPDFEKLLLSLVWQLICSFSISNLPIHFIWLGVADFFFSFMCTYKCQLLYYSCHSLCCYIKFTIIRALKVGFKHIRWGRPRPHSIVFCRERIFLQLFNNDAECILEINLSFSLRCLWMFLGIREEVKGRANLLMD